MERWPTVRLLSTAARLVELAWNEKLSSIGLTHAGVIAMEVLAVKGALSQAALAQIVRVQAQTMGKTLARLESHGHISRVRSQSDRRSHLVTLTEAGEAALARAVELEREVLGPVPVDSGRLRQELLTLVRDLAGRHASSPAIREIVSEPGPRAARADGAG